MASSVNEVFENMATKMAADPSKVENINAVYQFNVTGDDGGEWHVDLTGDAPAVASGPAESANCTVTVTDEDLLAIIDGSLNPQMAFMTGKVKISGDMSLAMKLGKILG
ncbi:MAG: SCP2 sterol-binding domain-containing protein [Candidatus Lernaella stagnicola]|nr:SCP2 sterol-binding domain-containing protein [Candidatus Lernaella stagnicola]